jgi:hypothetical protein
MEPHEIRQDTLGISRTLRTPTTSETHYLLQTERQILLRLLTRKDDCLLHQLLLKLNLLRFIHRVYLYFL